MHFFVFRNFHFYTFYRHFSIFSLYNISKFSVSSYLALRATNAVDVGQCRAVSYTSSDGVVPQNMLDLVWLDVVIKNIDTKALYVPLPIS